MVSNHLLLEYPPDHLTDKEVNTKQPVCMRLCIMASTSMTVMELTLSRRKVTNWGCTYENKDNTVQLTARETPVR